VDFDQGFRFGRHLDEVAGVKHKGVPGAQRRGLGEIDEQLRAFGAEERAVAVVPPLVIEDHSIHDPGAIDLMAAQQRYHAQHRGDRPRGATRRSAGIGCDLGLSLSGSRTGILVPQLRRVGRPSSAVGPPGGSVGGATVTVGAGAAALAACCSSRR